MKVRPMITLTAKQASRVEDAARFLEGLRDGKTLAIEIQDGEGNRIWDVEPDDELYKLIEKDVTKFLADLGVELA